MASARLAVVGWFLLLLLQYAATVTSAFASTPAHLSFGLRRQSKVGISTSYINKQSSALFTRGGDSTDKDDLRTVLVTGGTGYIGSHTCLELLNANYRVVVIDNLENSSEESLARVTQLLQDAKSDAATNIKDRLHFRNCDIRDEEGLASVLEEFPSITSCIHFAGLKAVGESVAKPLDYYGVNIGGTTTLLQQLQKAKVPHFVFSSSATVYGEPEMLPLQEHARLTATNPYGRTKLFIEEILRDLYASQPELWNILILRYFNPIGAHPSGRMGEDPQVCLLDRCVWVCGVCMHLHHVNIIIFAANMASSLFCSKLF